MVGKASFALIAVLAFPAPALADTGAVTVPPALSVGAGTVTLLIACFLMLDALALRNVAKGAAFADNISYVMACVLCLVASVLAGFVAGLLPAELSPQLVRFAADLLVTASMAFLGVYLFRVRRAVQRFISVLDDESMLAHGHEVEVESDAVAD